MNLAFIQLALGLLVSVTSGFSGEPPSSLVLDEPSVLSSNALSTLSTILKEHEKVSGDRVVVAVFSSRAPETDIDSFARKRFDAWELSSRKQQSGILVALAWKEREARIQVGPRAAAILGEEKLDRLLNGTLIRKLEGGSPSDALIETVASILQALDSPLIASGRLSEILKALPRDDSSAARPLAGESPEGVISPTLPFIGWTVLFLILGLAATSLTLLRTLRPEAHYTVEGWFRPTLTEDARAWVDGILRKKDAPSERSAGGAVGHW